MNAGRILLLSPYFHPEAISTGKYNTILASALSMAGANITVVTSYPFYPSWMPKRSNAAPCDVTVIRGGLWVRYPSTILLRRIVLELWYAAYVWLTIRRKRFAPDLIIAVFPPVLFFCLAKLLPGCRKVGIVHDFQGILGFSGEGRLSRATQFIVKRVESIAFRYCDRIIVLSESMARLAHKEYGIMEQKIQVAYPFVAITAEKRGRNKLGSILPSGVRHVVYSGALGKKQEPRKLYDFFCAAALRIPNARFHIFSEGPEFDNLRERHTSEPVKGVELHDLVGEEDLAELYDRSTIQVIPVAEGLSEACLPSKLPNIIASGCALFAICDEGSELANIVAKYGGMSVPRWDEHALIGSMIKFLNEIGRESSEMRRAKTAGLLKEQFSLDRLLNSVLHSPATLGVKIS